MSYLKQIDIYELRNPSLIVINSTIFLNVGVFAHPPKKGNNTKYTKWINVSKRDTCKNES